MNETLACPDLRENQQPRPRRVRPPSVPMEIVIADYDPAWPAWFAREEAAGVAPAAPT